MSVHPTSDGRRRALVEAIVANERRLHALALRMLADHQAAEDAVQETSVRALRSLDRFRGDSSMATWLYRITSNVCLDERRRRQLRPIPADMTDDWAGGPVEADFAESSVAATDLALALACLPVSQRQALILTDVLGLDYAGAGDLLGIPRGTLGSRVHRARRAVRDSLDPSFGEAA